MDNQKANAKCIYNFFIKISDISGTYVYLWMIHADVWQKPTQFCKAIIFQFKN